MPWGLQTHPRAEPTPPDYGRRTPDPPKRSIRATCNAGVDIPTNRSIQ